MAVTLVEIVAEGRRLEERTLIAHRDYPHEPLLHGTVHIERSNFYRTHGPRLLAVAEAAMEMRRCMSGQTTESTNEYVDSITAFDAAARGRSHEG